jgi:hypothetical protein
MTLVAAGTNAATNAGTDTGVKWVPRIPSFPRGWGPFMASWKRPVRHRMRWAPPAAGRRPPGAGWGHREGGDTESPYRRSHPSPQNRPDQQNWVHVSHPRARAGGRYSNSPGGGRRFG